MIRTEKEVNTSAKFIAINSSFFLAVKHSKQLFHEPLQFGRSVLIVVLQQVLDGRKEVLKLNHALVGRVVVEHLRWDDKGESDKGDQGR